MKKTKGIIFFTIDCTVQSTLKGLKEKEKETKAHAMGKFFFLA